MKINVFPIRSDLTHFEVEGDSKKLLDRLQDILACQLNICSFEELYDGDLALILIQTGGSEARFIEAFPHLRAPIYLLTYGSNNSLAASLEILSYLKKHKITGEILHGKPEYIAERIRELSEPAPRLGVIGKPSDWLINSLVDAKKARSRFGVELVYLETAELIEEYKNAVATQENLSATFDHDELEKALRVKTAIDSVAKKHDLQGVTIRCFDLLKELETTSCLALALGNSEGLVSACEGDVPALLVMEIAKRLLGEACFQANPSYVDLENNSLILAHCTLPLTMCESYRFDTHFESGIGVGIKGELKPGDITLLRISADLDHYFISDGRIKDNLSRADLCRTQVEVWLEKSVSYFLKNPLGNHHLLLRGHHQKELEAYLQNCGLTAVEF